jgi:hypothetical protein
LAPWLFCILIFFEFDAERLLVEKGYMTAPYPSSPCRLDLVKPIVIFGGVLLLSAAFCGAVDTMQSSSSFVEEVKVVRAEGAAGGHEADLLVACQHDKSSLMKEIRCRAQRYS